MRRLKVIVLILALILLPTGCDSESGKPIKLGNQGILGVQNYDSSPVKAMLILPQKRNHHDSKKAMEQAALCAKRYFNMDLEMKAVGRSYQLYIDEFDAMVVSSGEELNELMDKNKIMDLSEAFEKYAPNYYSQFTPEELAQVTYDGKIMAIPNRSFASNRVSVAVRSDLLEKCNIESITNFEEYESFLKAVKNLGDPTLVSATVMRPTNIFMEYYGYAEVPCGMVYRIDDPEYKLIPWENTDEFRGILERQYDWINQGYFHRAFYVVGGSIGHDSYQLHYGSDLLLSHMKLGRLASAIISWDEGVTLTRLIGEKNEYKLFPLNMDKAAFSSSVCKPAIVIRKGSRNVERILRFIDWVHSSQENYDLFMYGTEGENYTLEDAMVKLPEKAGMIHYYWSGSEAFRDERYERKFVSDVKSNVTGYSPKDDLNLKTLPAASFFPRLQNLRDILNERGNLTGLMLINADYLNVMRNTPLSVAIKETYKVTMDECVRRSDGISTESIMKQVQRQLDEWKSERAK